MAAVRMACGGGRGGRVRLRAGGGLAAAGSAALGESAGHRRDLRISALMPELASK